MVASHQGIPQFFSRNINGVLPRVFEFRDFRVDAVSLHVYRRDALLNLPPKAVELLVQLLARPGETVTKTELLNEIWPDTVVAEANLAQYIYLLRKTLDDPDQPSSIVTLPGRGYRFTEKVSTVEVTAQSPAPRSNLAVPPPTLPVLAVLPFTTLDKLSRAASLGVGVAHALASRLLRLHGISVRAVGSREGATLILKGTVQIRDGRVRVSAELIDALEGSLRWAESVEETQTNCFSVQDTIADRLVWLLGTNLSDEYAELHSAARQRALRLYLKGRFYWYKRNEQAFLKAIQHFEKAIAIEPRYAPAYAGLADCFNLYAYYALVPSRNMGTRALKAARYAIELDPNLAEAYASLGRAVVDNEWDWESGEVLFRRALSLNPHSATARGWYACLLVARGREEEGMLQMMRAHQLDPNSLTINRDLGFIHYLAGRWVEGVAQLEDTLEMDTSAELTITYLAATYEQVGMTEKGLTILKRALRADPDNARLLAELGCLHATAGNLDEAMDIARRLTELARSRYVPPYNMAMLYASIGDADRALHWLSIAKEDRPWRMIYITIDPRFNALRNDPRFALVARPFLI